MFFVQCATGASTCMCFNIYKERATDRFNFIRHSGTCFPHSQFCKSRGQSLSGVQLSCISLRSIVVRDNRNNCMVAYIPCIYVSFKNESFRSGQLTIDLSGHSIALVLKRQYHPRLPDQSPRDLQRRWFFDQEARSAVDPTPRLQVWLL